MKKRTGLVRAGRQGMRVVTAGSEGVADEYLPGCPNRAVLYYYNDSVSPCAYDQSVLPEEYLQTLLLFSNMGLHSP